MDTNTYLIEKVLNGNLLVTVLVTLTATLSTVINGLIVGRELGSDALVAFGLASPMLILLSALAGVFGNGGTIRCAKHIGAGDKAKVTANFTVTLVTTLLVGVIYTLFCVICSDFIADLFGATGNIKEMTSSYIRGVGLSTIPFLLLQNLMLYLRMDDGQKLTMIAMIVTVAVSALSAYLSSTQTSLGLFGISLSVMIGSVAGLIVTLPHFRKKDRMLGFGSIRGTGKELKEVCMAGLPTAINRGSQTLKNFALNSFLLSFSGTAAVLALSVQTNVYQFLIAISTGYGLMVAMMCGIFYGEKDKRAIVDTIKVTMKSGFIISTIVGIILFILAEPVASLFICDGGDLSMAADCLRMFALSQPTSTLCLILLYMYQSMGNIVLSTVISVTRGVGYVVLFSFVLAPLIGVNGVWISFFLADIFSIFTIMIVIKIKTGTFPLHCKDYILVPESDFDAKIICDISLRNDMSEVMKLSDRISGMCLENGVDEDRANRIALCIEEMAGNVVEHAFTDNKEHFMDIRIVLKGQDLIFRMRDNGTRFNPLTADTEGHFGLKIIRATAKSIDYCYSVKLNNLTVTV